MATYGAKMLTENGQKSLSLQMRDYLDVESMSIRRSLCKAYFGQKAYMGHAMPVGC